MRRVHYMVAALMLLASVAQAQVICPGEQSCPVGYHETLVNCKVCVMDGYDLTRPTDTDACEIGTWLTPDQKQCCPNGTILKSDGQCCVTNEADPCTCQAGWHQVAAFTCCPDGMTLATDIDGCCTVNVTGVCCPPGLIFSNGACVPKQPQGVVVR